MIEGELRAAGLITNRIIERNGNARTMSVNKFGMSLRDRDIGEIASGKIGTSVETLRNYVRDTALCLNADVYDAKECKIRRLAMPESDTDATSKSYVDGLRNDVHQLETSVSSLSSNVDKLWRSGDS